MKRAVIAILAIAGLALGGFAVSHSGGVDKNGCHKDHKNGDYHCH
jgi:hypothetical protein